MIVLSCCACGWLGADGMPPAPGMSADSGEIIGKWQEYFGETRFFC